MDDFRDSSEAIDNGEPSTFWQGLLAGHFSLIEQYDQGGRAFLVARRNETKGPALTARERRVLSLAARGLPNEAIGAELELPASAIAAHLANAAQKLNISSRARLVETAATFGDEE